MPPSKSFEIKLDDKTSQLFEEFKKRFSREELYNAVLAFFGKQSPQVASNVVDKYLSGGSGLGRRTGSLARSVEGRAQRLNGVPAMKVGIFRGPALKYAAVHEFGTQGAGGALPTIVPRRAKALAYAPEGSPALTPAGVDRFGGPRNFPGELTFVPFKNGRNAVGGLYRKADLERLRRGNRDGRINLRRIKAVYVLLRKLDLPPQRFLERGVLEKLPEVVDELKVFLGNYLTGKAT